MGLMASYSGLVKPVKSILRYLHQQYHDTKIISIGDKLTYSANSTVICCPDSYLKDMLNFSQSLVTITM